MFNLCTVILFGILFFITGINCLGCRDESGKTVDFYYGYKLPSSDRYYSIVNDEWELSSRSVNDVQSIFGQTISPIYNNDNILGLLYNDEAPNGTVSFTDGHTKGVVATDNESGFWLIHSVPHFPPSLDNGRYSYPRTGIKYGQSFLCITINKTNMDIIGKQLLYNEPFIYSSRISNDLRSSFPLLVRAISMEKITSPPFSNVETIISTNGVQFQSYAKNRKFGKELYEDWVAPNLQTNLLVETWQNGPGKIHSDCSKTEQVLNIEEISLVNTTFKNQKDHSKWAVSMVLGVESVDNWICVGDINRAEHQKERGGGTVCHNSESISKAYRNTVKETEPCIKIYLL